MGNDTQIKDPNPETTMATMVCLETDKTWTHRGADKENQETTDKSPPITIDNNQTAETGAPTDLKTKDNQPNTMRKPKTNTDYRH